MAPPSQAGKFKPRKPAKKINVGSSNAEAVPIAVPSAPLAAAASSSSSANPRAERHAGRGRGGRGGRGPPEQGQVFFTATPKPDATRRGSSTAAKASGTSTAANRGSGEGASFKRSAALRPGGRDSDEAAAQEEVVGVMEEGVGSTRAGTTSTLGRYPDFHPETTTTKSSPSAGARRDSRRSGQSWGDRYAYDSDSSNDAPVSIQRRCLQPVSLPSLALDATDSEATITQLATSTFTAQNKPIDNPLFVSEDDKEGYRRESNGFYLFQLPTRLVQMEPDDKAESANDEDGDGTELQSDNTLGSTAAQVSVPPVHKELFDNVLSSASGGYLGKIVVYKSGRSEFLMEGPNAAGNGRRVRTKQISELSMPRQRFFKSDTLLLTMFSQ